MRRALMVVLLLLTTACGGGDNANGPSAGPSSDVSQSTAGDVIDPSKVDVCSLLDVATVQRLTGVSVPFDSQGSRGSCFWGATRPGVGAYVEVKVFRSKGLSATRSGFAPPACTTAPLDAVGEEAEVITCPAGSATPQSKVQLRAYERGVMVTVLVNDANVSVAKTQLVSAAQAALVELRGAPGAG